MKFLFIVQGEGRGHMTQAISFSQLLQQQGHELIGVVVGKSKRREIPAFFQQKISCPLTLVASPNFETDKSHRRILLGKTLWSNLSKSNTYWKSLHQIHSLVIDKKPDVIVNFYDLLGGLYTGLFRPQAKTWSIGHQYLCLLENYHFAPTRGIEKYLYRLHTRLTAWGSSRLLALSFEETPIVHPKIYPVPPLLRKEVADLVPHTEHFFLAYMVNPGYAEELIAQAQAHPTIRIKAYWDKKDAPETLHPLPNLSLHQVNDKAFLEDMAACSGLVTTAGFESVCEAVYLGKPVYVIPVEGQYEQACNALEISRLGIGLSGNKFDFFYFSTQLDQDRKFQRNFNEWCSKWSEIVNFLVKKEESPDSTPALSKNRSKSIFATPLQNMSNLKSS